MRLCVDMKGELSFNRMLDGLCEIYKAGSPAGIPNIDGLTIRLYVRKYRLVQAKNMTNAINIWEPRCRRAVATVGRKLKHGHWKMCITWP